MRLIFLLLLSSITFSLVPTPSGSVEYYVTPTSPPNTDCPQPCHTLEYYAMDTSLLNNQENVSLLFLDGQHVLNSTLKISNTKLVLFARHTDSEIQLVKLVTIECYSRCQLQFKGITSLTMQNFELKGKPLQFEHWEDIVLEQNKSPVIKITNANTVAIKSCDFIENNGVFAFDVYGKSILATVIEITILNKASIEDCNFTNSGTALQIAVPENRQTKFILSILSCIISKNVHAVLINKVDVQSQIENTTSVGSLNHTNIMLRNVVVVNTTKTAVKVRLPSFFNFKLNLSLIDCDFRGNHIILDVQEEYTLLFINTPTQTTSLTHFLLQNVSVINNQVEDAPVIKIYRINSVTIKDCNFINNKRAALEIAFFNLQFTLMLFNCNFSRNEEVFQFVNVYARSLMRSDGPISSSTITITNVTMINNGPTYFWEPIVNILDIKKITIQNCKFMHNSGTGLAVHNSMITFTGTVLFFNNTGIKGGALALYNSYIVLSHKDTVNTTFRANTATDVGGAIFMTLLENNFTPKCFFLLDGSPENYETITTVKVSFQNNTALHGGDDIHGGTLYGECEPFLTFNDKRYRNKLDFIPNIFHFSSTTISSVTSDPTRVCLCDSQGTLQCANMDYIFRKLPTHYPGETFTVSAVVVGYDFGSTPGVVYSEVLQNGNISFVEHHKRVHEIKNHYECTQLKLSIETLQTNTEYTLRLYIGQDKIDFLNRHLITDFRTLLSFPMYLYKNLNIIDKYLQYSPVDITVKLTDCPPGFILKNTPPYMCTCHPTLHDNGITVCIITNHTGWVYRSGTVWVSASFTDNKTNSFTVHQYCPYNYCKPENISVNLQRPNTQCALNHSGALCGGCQGNLSLALGSFRCIPCSNSYVSLLIVFILAGLILVFFIKILDLTVAQGTINGLIFYANIIWANKSILFTTTYSLHPAQQILHTFIAWLNLDLGIETCFIEGLDAYWKTWLQFIFPLYVWAIAGVIIIVSHYSTRASRLFGNNSVPVLATLILLSYMKLLRTIITSLAFSLLDYPEGTRVVWSLDGNIPYFGAAHTILFLISLAVLLLLWLPYTTVLFTLQWLRRKSYIKPLRWINRWKPLFDAYLGQLKPKHHYWVGLLLLVRVVLLVLFSGTSAIAPRINIMAIAFTGLVLFIYMYTSMSGLVYKSRCLSFLESSFITNLTTLAITKLYMQPNDPAYETVVYISITIVLLEFLGIVVYHTWCRIKSTYQTYKRRHKEEENENRELRVLAHNNMHYREPLLDSSVQEINN